MRVEITAIHPDDAFADGVVLECDTEKTSVIGLTGDLKILDTTEDGYNGGLFLPDKTFQDFGKARTFFYAIKYRELPDES